MDNEIIYILVGVIGIVVIIDFLIRRKKNTKSNNSVQEFKDTGHSKNINSRKFLKPLLIILIVISVPLSVHYYTNYLNPKININEINFNENNAYIKSTMKHFTGTITCEHGDMGYYNNGKPDGVIMEWHNNGQLKSEGKWGNGLLNGKYYEWYDNGQLKLEENYSLGKKNDLNKKWYDNGQLRIEKNYKNGLLNGIYKVWFPNGQLEYEKNFNDKGKPDGSHKEWNHNGTQILECNYINGILNGKYYKWHNGGTLKIEENYKDGERDGLYRKWYDNGALEEEVHYKNGEFDGLKTEWTRSGEVTKHWYDNGFCQEALNRILSLLKKENKFINKEKLYGDDKLLNEGFLNVVERGYTGSFDQFKILIGAVKISD